MLAELRGPASRRSTTQENRWLSTEEVVVSMRKEVASIREEEEVTSTKDWIWLRLRVEMVQLME